MEAGKERLARDSVRDATEQEIHALKRENGELKQAVADLSLEAYRLKKRPCRWWRTAPLPAHERCGQGVDLRQRGVIPRDQTPGTQGVGCPEEHLLPMAQAAATLMIGQEAIQRRGTASPRRSSELSWR